MVKEGKQRKQKEKANLDTLTNIVSIDCSGTQKNAI